MRDKRKHDRSPRATRRVSHPFLFYKSSCFSFTRDWHGAPSTTLWIDLEQKERGASKTKTQTKTKTKNKTKRKNVIFFFFWNSRNVNLDERKAKNFSGKEHHPTYYPVPSSRFRSRACNPSRVAEIEGESMILRKKEKREKCGKMRKRTCYSIFYYCLVIYNLYIIN